MNCEMKLFNFLRGITIILVIILFNCLNLLAGDNLIKKLKPLPEGQISTVYIGKLTYKNMAGRPVSVELLTRFILESQSNSLFGESIYKGESSGIYRSVIKILEVGLNKIKIRDIWGNESKGEYHTALYNTQDSWRSFSGRFWGGSSGFADGKSINGKNVIKMYLDIVPPPSKEEESLAGLYQTYITLKTCYKVREGQSSLYIKKMEMDKIKSYTKKLETMLFEESPKLKSSKDKIWKDTSKKTTKSLGYLESAEYSLGLKVCRTSLDLFMMIAKEYFPPTGKIEEKDF